MNWISELYDLYEKNEAIAGSVEYRSKKSKSGEELVPLVLLPVFHTTVAAQITVTIDGNGTFLSAVPVSEEEKMTIIPVTEESGSRTSSPKAHPFCDNLKYLAGDYIRYYRAGGKEKDFGKYHELYIAGLEAWSEFPHAHKKVLALYRYIVKGVLIRDLVTSGVLVVDEDQMLVSNVKIQNITQTDAFVRFRIQTELDLSGDILGDSSGVYCPECWLDKTLQQNFIEYYKSTFTGKDLCYLTGENTQTSYLHPKKIRNEGDGSKLISSNDGINFTYRGRFTDKTEAFAIGYEASQKIHNALKWIIRKQGNTWDTMCTVVWESDLKKLPDWSADTDAICGQFEEWEVEEQSPQYSGTGEEKAARLYRAMNGYGRYLPQMSRVVLLSLDAATTGRLAMTEYQSFESARYLKQIEYWHDSCSWVHSKYKNGAKFEYSGMMGVRTFAEVLYGTEQGGFLSLNGKSKMYAEVCKRLLPCILQGKRIPADMVNLAIHKASSPVSYEKWYNWEQVLTLACSLVKKQRYDRMKKSSGIEKEEWSVALNRESHDRSYLYGRLLAVADRIEYQTFIKVKDGARETNARRYMSAFSQRPYRTWKVIEEKIQPYQGKLRDGERIFYQNLLDEIYVMFMEGDFERSDGLDGLYLLGYHSQSYELKHKEE